MERALSTINQLPSGRDQVKVFFSKVKEEILLADGDPLKILVQLKYAEKVIADILKDRDIENHFLDEFQLYAAEKIVEVNGAKLNQQETGMRYDYNASGDPVWMDLDKEIKELAEKKKEREAFLKTISESGVVDPETGVFINRPPRTSKTKIVVKL